MRQWIPKKKIKVENSSVQNYWHRYLCHWRECKKENKLKTATLVVCLQYWKSCSIPVELF